MENEQAGWELRQRTGGRRVLALVAWLALLTAAFAVLVVVSNAVINWQAGS